MNKQKILPTFLDFHRILPTEHLKTLLGHSGGSLFHFVETFPHAVGSSHEEGSPAPEKNSPYRGDLENDFCLQTMLLRFDVQLPTWVEFWTQNCFWYLIGTRLGSSILCLEFLLRSLSFGIGLWSVIQNSTNRSTPEKNE